MKRQAEQLGLEYEIVDAVDGATLSDEFKAQVCDTDALEKYSWWLTNGAIGCALSHYEAYKRIITQGLPAAFVVEDDILLPRDISGTLDAIAKVMHENEVVSLEYRMKKQISFSTIGSRKAGDFELFYPVSLPGLLSAAAYCLSLKAAQGLIDVIKPIKVTADSWNYFYDRQAIAAFSCVFPAPVKTANFKTSIDYIKKGSLKEKFSSFVNNNRIPILYNLLEYRRRKNKMADAINFTFTQEPSPIHLSIIKKSQADSASH